MRVGWVAGAIRGKALARRCLGEEVRQRVAEKGTLAEALGMLADSTYGHRLRTDMDLETAQHAVAETTLWHLRVLAGWLPPRGVEVARVLAAWFEARDLQELAVAISTGGAPRFEPFRAGTLATTWARATAVTSLAELRALLARSEWGDPGGDTLADVLLGLRLGWARRLGRTFRRHPEWGAGELALATAVALFLRADDEGRLEAKRVPELGPSWARAQDVTEFAARLPAPARWALRDVDSADALWQAERTWWERVESDAVALLRDRSLGRSTVVGAAAALLADCWRVRTSLAESLRGTSASEENHG